MNINILRYSLFGIAGGQEVDRNFSQIYEPFKDNPCLSLEYYNQLQFVLNLSSRLSLAYNKVSLLII